MRLKCIDTYLALRLMAVAYQPSYIVILVYGKEVVIGCGIEGETIILGLIELATVAVECSCEDIVTANTVGSLCREE